MSIHKSSAIFALLLLVSFRLAAQISLQVASYGEYLAPGQVKPWHYLDFEGKADALQPGTLFDLVTDEGQRYPFAVEKREAQPTPEGRTRVLAKCGTNADQLMQAFHTCYAVSPGQPYPGKTSTNPDMVVEQETPAPVVDFTCLLDGNDWSAGSFFHSALYYQGGIKMLDPSGAPYLQLAFKATNAPDNRQLTIAIRNYKGGLGTYPGMEVLLSGSADGVAENVQMCGYQDNPTYPDQKTNFVFEITDFTRVSDEIAYISGNCHGKLKGIMGSPDVQVMNGSFQKVEVRVFTQGF